LYEYAGWRLGFHLSFADKIFGDWTYLKTRFEVEKNFGFFKLRGFSGKIFGQAPEQELFFLSGRLRITPLPDILFSQRGYFSPQAHLHITGDGSMRGYQTMHINSEKIYCLNLEFPRKSPIRLFADIGYYGNYAFDAGASIVIGPVSLNLPFYTLTSEPWRFRWSIGF
jgi:hypothetical protein